MRTSPRFTVDNIEVAQFIYLLLHNQKIRDVIDTITSKTVLIPPSNLRQRVTPVFGQFHLERISGKSADALFQPRRSWTKQSRPLDSYGRPLP